MARVVSRRGLFRIAAAGAAGVPLAPPPMGHGPDVGSVGEVNLRRAAVDPMRYLTQFDWGKASTLPGGRTLREYQLVATDREIEIAPGVMFPAWTYNAQVPGPTLRAREGDRLRIHFINAGGHPHKWNQLRRIPVSAGSAGGDL